MAVARKNVPVFALKVNAPLAPTFALPTALSPVAFAPPKILTVAPLLGWPPWVTRPVTIAPRPTSSRGEAHGAGSDRGGGRDRPRDVDVHRVPGVYGVQNADPRTERRPR